MWRLVLAAVTIVGVGLAVAYGQIVNPSPPGVPGGTGNQLQFNTGTTFGGISGVTSDMANVGFATSSNLILYSQTPGLCLTVDANFNVISQSCAAGSQTSIAAGSNITTGGTASNITVNVVATPSLTSLILSGNLTAGTAQFTGAASGTTATFQTITDSSVITGCVQSTNGLLSSTGVGCATQVSTPSIAAGTNITTSGTAANTTINVVATPSFTSVIVTGNLTGATAQITGWLTGPGANFQTATIAGALVGSTGNFSGNLTAGTAQFTGAASGTTAVFQTITDAGISAANQCIQATNGVLAGFGVPCATQVSTPSIAAGANITTSGTAANTTITATPTGASNTVQFNNAGAFGGDTGFQYAGGSTGIVTHTLGNVTTTNARALSIIGTLSSSTVQFDAPIFANITTSAFAVGSKLADIQASGLSVFGVSPSGAINSAALQSAAAQCLQVSAGGLITGFGVPCATQVITPSITAGTNITTSGTALSPTISVVAAPSFTSVISTSNLTGVIAGITGWLTAPGANLQTATIAGALIGSSTANFTGNLTGSTAQFSGLLTGTTANFAGNLTGSTAQFSGAVTGTTATFQTATMTAATINGWFTYNGTQRTAADTAFINTVFVNLATLTVNAGRTYKLMAELPIKAAAAATGGIAVRIGGGATATNIVYDGWIVDFGAVGGFNSIKGAAQAAAMTTTIGNVTLSGTTGHITLIGTMTVNAAGTLTLQAAGFSTVTAASAVTVERGSTFVAEDIP